VIYCPKCRVQTEQHDADGNPIGACPSCRVGWLNYLEAMACDALWVGVVKREKHDLYCPKCGYERTEADGSTPRTDCPRCGVIYAKVFPTKTPLEQQRIASPSIASSSVEQQSAGQCHYGNH